jgi:hypothetical protein
MSFYDSIWAQKKKEQRRIAVGLLALRRRLAGEGDIPPKTMESNLLLATWNIGS